MGGRVLLYVVRAAAVSVRVGVMRSVRLRLLLLVLLVRMLVREDQYGCGRRRGRRAPRCRRAPAHVCLLVLALQMLVDDARHRHRRVEHRRFTQPQSRAGSRGG